MSTHTQPADRAESGAPRCARCGAALQNPFFCGACRTLQEPAGLSHFAALGLEPRFDLDTAELRRRYLALSREVHPDRFGGATGDLQRSQQVSARLNAAWQALSDPLRRAEHLLELAGGPSGTDDKRVPQAVLAETLMLREEIDEARAAGDSAALERIRASVADSQHELHARIATLARKLGEAAPPLNELREALNSTRYHERMLSALDDADPKGSTSHGG